MTNSKLFFGCAYRDLPKNESDSEATVREILAAVEIMKPKPSPYPLVRIGGSEDGSYLLPDDLKGIEACYSPGVNNRKEFEDEIAINYGIKSHMCDYSSDVENFRTPLIENMQTFRKLWLDTDGNEDCISIKDWVAELSPNRKSDLMLQMDIEGAEYRNIINCPDEVLGRFRVLVFEVHSLDMLLDHGIRRDVLLPFLKKIDRQFACVHAHPNNGGGRYHVREIETHIPIVLELTFIRRDRLKRAIGTKFNAPLLPHPLDIVSTFCHPMPLDGAWINNQPRASASAIKMLEDQVWFLEASAVKSKRQLSDALEMISQSAHKNLQSSYCKEHFIDFPHQPTLKEVAIGCKFVTSSGLPRQGTVPAQGQHNLFFHTEPDFSNYITVDLGNVRKIKGIKIYNRSDACGERARLLFLRASLENSDDFSETILLPSGLEFLEAKTPLSYHFNKSILARFIKISSPLYTSLHFSGLEVYAEDGN